MKSKKVQAIIKNEKGEVCHTLKDVVAISLARNETLTQTKAYIVKDYSDYTVEFVVK